MASYEKGKPLNCHKHHLYRKGGRWPLCGLAHATMIPVDEPTRARWAWADGVRGVCLACQDAWHKASQRRRGRS